MIWKLLAASGFLVASGCLVWTVWRERKLLRRRKEQTLFYASLGHELKTPLNGILGFAELLQLDNVTLVEQRQFVRNIAFSANTLLSMINNMLDCAKLNAGQMQLRPRPIDLATLTSGLPAMLNALLLDKKLCLEIAIPPDLPRLSLDPERIHQILLNLIGNAIKFSDNGVVTLQIIWESTCAAHGILTLKISDQGQGIPDDYRKRIFDPFVQCHSNAGNGTGLGLSITLQLIELMHGSIHLESELGKGSCFTVTLPCAIASGA